MSTRPNGNQQIRNRRQCVRAYRLHRDGFTVREIAALLQKTPERVSTMLILGKRFDDDSTGEQSK